MDKPDFNKIRITPKALVKAQMFKPWIVPEGYESPIEVMTRQLSEKIIEDRENRIMLQVNEQLGVNVDKEELIKALKYDRRQFDAGYMTGYKAGCREYKRSFGDWIPVTMRPMTKEEEEEACRTWGVDKLYDDEKFMFNCPLPEEGQQILISTPWGVKLDTCTYDPDGGFGLEENGDWDRVEAWQPLPKRYEPEESLGGDEE